MGFFCRHFSGSGTGRGLPDLILPTKLIGSSVFLTREAAVTENTTTENNNNHFCNWRCGQ